MKLLILMVCGVAYGFGAVTQMTTESGIPFAMVGEKGATPAPALFVFATTAEQTLTDPNFYKMASQVRAERGALLVSIDVPGHGSDRRAGERDGIWAWRSRAEQGEDVAAKFTASVTAVLDHLIAKGYVDPARVAVSGTSRGGFMALQAAAADARFRWVVAFAPVTDLTVLLEFKGMESEALTQRLSVINLAGKLAGRSIWMCIGNNDDRVGTEQAIALTRRVVAESVKEGLKADVELHVQSSKGHTIAPESHPHAAAWLLERVAH